MKTGNFTLCFSLVNRLQKAVLPAFITILLALSGATAQAQCGAGWNYAKVNWDNLDYLITTGNYTGFVTAAMRDNQFFAIGRNRLNLNASGTLVKVGENATHTGEAGSFGVGQDVEYSANGTITLTFDTAVMNVQFSLYDIDASQVATVTARDPANVPINVTMARVAGTSLTVVGSGTVTAVGTANASGVGNGANTAVLNVTVPGGAAGVKSVTIVISGTVGNFWLSDITACVYGGFPNNYYAAAEPFTGQPAYTLATPDSNTVSMINLGNASAKQVFRDAGSATYVNGLGYDIHNHRLYYVHDFTASPQTNRTLRKYDFNTETMSTVIADITSLGIPTFNRGVESAGSAFYDSCLYFGIEGTNNARNSNRESIIWRISFNAAGTPNGIAQVFALPADNGGGTILKDWGDFNIYNGVLYDFNSGNGGTTAGFYHYSLQTDSILNTYATGVSLIGRQSALRWDGQLYWMYDSLATYSNGTVGPRTRITGVGGIADWTGFSGDGSDPFKPKSDFGDAPASYDPNPLAPATHEYDSTMRLGPTFDREWSKSSSAGASADGTDEDGIIAPLPIFTHSQNYYTIPITVLNKSGAQARVAAWMDFNNNGVFEASEGITVNVNSSPSMQNVTLNWAGFPAIPPAMMNIYCRIRITSLANGMTTNNATGYYSNGEVEDYLLLVDDVLPVNLVDFTAKAVSASTVQLNWTATNEVTVQQYMLQRSADGIHFEDFKEVQPTNNASLTLDYVQLDKQPLAGSSFYRIKMTDTKGRITYSVVRKVTLHDGAGTGLVYPNPFVNSFSFDITLPTAGDTELRILDFTGKLLYSKVLTGKAGSNTFKVEGIGHLPKGYYIAEFSQHGKKLFREKISRQ